MLSGRVYIAGHTGLVGSAILTKCVEDTDLEPVVRTHEELELTDYDQVKDFVYSTGFEYAILAAAKVGGIKANSTDYADFLFQNTSIQNTLFRVLREYYEDTKVLRKVIFLGSSCIYPKLSPQPMTPDLIMQGVLEDTNDCYAIAKLSGVVLCKNYNKENFGVNYSCLMPPNIYGPGDNFDLDTSHVLAALLRKFHEAKIQGSPFVTVWGTGDPVREFLHSSDLADACFFALENFSGGESLGSVILNVGTGSGISIRELANLIKEVIGYSGSIQWDSSKPDGMPYKVMYCEKVFRMGWRPKISLRRGIESFYDWYCENA